MGCSRLRARIRSCYLLPTVRPTLIEDRLCAGRAPMLSDLHLIREHRSTMLNLISLIIGVVALLLAIVAFLPLLGWANWFIIPLALIGAAVGMTSRGNAGRNPVSYTHLRAHETPE